MARLKANALKPGDVIGIVAPASPARSEERIEKSVAYFERLGYRVELGKHLTVGSSLPSPTYLAASDKDRVADLHAMFRNKRIKAIFYHRGGFGSIRLLDSIDYDLVRANPKIIVGYSDATSLFIALHKKAGLASCYFGPMAGVDLWDDIDPFTEENLWKAVTTNAPLGALPGVAEATVDSKTRTAKGRFVGGNLMVFTSLLGTPYQPSFRNVIPMFEEIDEKPRRIDAMFAQLRLAGLFDDAKAILLGQFTNCDTDAEAPTRPLREVFSDYFGKLPVPVVSQLPFGHVPKMWTIPYGVMLHVETKRGEATIAVVDSPLQ